jgi:hypothetical protein
VGARGRPAGCSDARSARSASLGCSRSLRSPIYIADYTPAAACSTSPTSSGSRSLGIHYKLGVDGLNVFLVG